MSNKIERNIDNGRKIIHNIYQTDTYTKETEQGMESKLFGG